MRSAEKLARVCKAFSVVTRVRIIELLRGQALCVNALASRLDVTQGAVSQHLRILREAGLVTAEKRGYFVHYRLNEAALAGCQAMLDRFLQAESEQADSCSAMVSGERKTPCAKRRRRSAKSRSN